MPTIYSEINLEISVTLDNNHDFEFKQWTDDSLKSTRSGYGHSEFAINFIIPNPEDEMSPGMFAVENDDIYFGAFDVKKITGRSRSLLMVNLSQAYLKCQKKS